MTDVRAEVPACDGVFTAKVTRLSDGRNGGMQIGGGYGAGPVPPPMNTASARNHSSNSIAGGGAGAGGVRVGDGGDGECLGYALIFILERVCLAMYTQGFMLNTHPDLVVFAPCGLERS